MHSQQVEKLSLITVVVKISPGLALKGDPSKGEEGKIHQEKLTGHGIVKFSFEPCRGTRFDNNQSIYSLSKD